jgi:transcriptional regulator of arginine metabolism
MTSITHLLREILSAGKISTQSEIQQILEQQGILSSQSKISRLLHQIGAVKIVDEHGKTHYRLPHEKGLLHELVPLNEKKFMRQWILNITANETLIIVHTTPGAAGMVARIIDQHRIDLNVLGTLAGDDTIFVAPQSQAAIDETITAITELLNL